MFREFQIIYAHCRNQLFCYFDMSFFILKLLKCYIRRIDVNESFRDQSTKCLNATAKWFNYRQQSVSIKSGHFACESIAAVDYEH